MAPKRDVSFLQGEYDKGNPMLVPPLERRWTGWNTAGDTYAFNRMGGTPYVYKVDPHGKDPRGWRAKETALWRGLNQEERARGVAQSGKDFIRYSSKGDAASHALRRGSDPEDVQGAWLSLPKVAPWGSMMIDGEDTFNKGFSPVGSVLQHEYTHGQDNRYLSSRPGGLQDPSRPLALTETPTVLSGTGNTLRALHAARPGILDGVKIGPAYSQQYDANMLRRQAGKYLYGEDAQGRQTGPPGNMVDIMGRPETQQWLKSFRTGGQPPVIREMMERQDAERIAGEGYAGAPAYLPPQVGGFTPRPDQGIQEGRYMLSQLLNPSGIPPRAPALAGSPTPALTRPAR